MEHALSKILLGNRGHRELLAYLRALLPASAAAWRARAACLRRQVLAVVEWACQHYRVPAVHLHAAGQVMPVVGLIAAALKPGRFCGLTTATLIDSLGRLIDWPLPYASAAPLFCFGLLPEFDIPALIELSAPVPLDDSGRGPLRR